MVRASPGRTSGRVLGLCLAAGILLHGTAQAQFMPERARPFTTESSDQILYNGQRIWITVCANYKEFTVAFDTGAKAPEIIKLKASGALDWPGNCTTRIASRVTLKGTVSPDAKGWHAFEQVSRP